MISSLSERGFDKTGISKLKLLTNGNFSDNGRISVFTIMKLEPFTLRVILLFEKEDESSGGREMAGHFQLPLFIPNR